MTLFYLTSEPLKMRPYYCYATKTSRRTIRSQVLQPASAGKRADMSELHCITPKLWTWLYYAVWLNQISFWRNNRLIYSGKDKKTLSMKSDNSISTQSITSQDFFSFLLTFHDILSQEMFSNFTVLYFLAVLYKIICLSVFHIHSFVCPFILCVRESALSKPFMTF